MWASVLARTASKDLTEKGTLEWTSEEVLLGRTRIGTRKKYLDKLLKEGTRTGIYGLLPCDPHTFTCVISLTVPSVGTHLIATSYVIQVKRT